MFPTMRLHVFVCLALGIAVQAAPSGAAGVEIAARHDYDNGYHHDNGDVYDNDHAEDTIFIEGLNGSDGLGAIDDALDSLDGTDDGDLFKRTAVNNIFGQLGLSGDAEASTGLSVDDLLSGTNLGANVVANLGAGGSAMRRQLLDGLLSNLNSGVGLSGSGSASASGSSDGLLDNLDLGSLLDGDLSVGLDTSVDKRQILENLGLGTNFSLNDLLSALGFFNTNALVTASVSNGVTVSVTATPTATGTFSIPTGTLSFSTGTLSIPTGTISRTTTPTTVSATAGATATAGVNTNGFDLNGLLSQLGLGNGNFGNFGANAGVNGNTNLGGLDLSLFGL